MVWASRICGRWTSLIFLQRRGQGGIFWSFLLGESSVLMVPVEKVEDEEEEDYSDTLFLSHGGRGEPHIT